MTVAKTTLNNSGDKHTSLPEPLANIKPRREISIIQLHASPHTIVKHANGIAILGVDIAILGVDIAILGVDRAILRRQEKVEAITGGGTGRHSGPRCR